MLSFHCTQCGACCRHLKAFGDLYADLDDGSGVLVLVDVLGGSPFNTAACQLRQKHIESVTGLNFPMLLAALEGRETAALTELKGTCAQAARDGVVDVRGYMES